MSPGVPLRRWVLFWSIALGGLGRPAAGHAGASVFLGDLLLVGDSLGQVIYGLPSTVPVTPEMMAAHGAAVVRGSYHAVVVIDMPFGSYERSPEQAFESAARLLKETGAAGVKMEGGAAMAATVRFLTERGIPVMGHVGLTPQAVNMLGGYGARGRSEAEAAKILDDAVAVAEAGAFLLVVEGVVERARKLTLGAGTEAGTEIGPSTGWPPVIATASL